MEFRRNHRPQSSSAFKRRAVLLIALIFCFSIFLGVVFEAWPKKEKFHTIQVSFLANQHYLINGDTTNFDNFASVLRKQVQIAKKQPLKIELYLILPKDQNMGQVAEIVQVANAFEGVRLRLSSEQ